MAQRGSARQEESIGTTSLLNEGALTPKQQGFVRGRGVGRPLNSQERSRGISGHGVWHFVS
mgnify:CR=1 FL=1